MNTIDRDSDGLGPDFPGAVGNALLTVLLPTHYREAIIGDLIEQAEADVAPRDGAAAARRWFWRQAVVSASPLYARRTTTEVTMTRGKWITLVLLIVAGLVMALDPNVFSSSPLVIGLVVAAIAVPVVAGLISGNVHTLIGAAAISAVLLLTARLTSGLEIRWYAMAFMLFVILNLGRIFQRRLESA